MAGPTLARRTPPGATLRVVPRDLYICDLDQIDYADIEAFVALSAPQAARPKEGVRLDFKVAASQGLAKVAAAFSNSQGGLLFVGVDETNGVPSAMPGIAPSRTDLKTTLSNLIRTGVDPLPDHEIGATRDPNAPHHEVAVIRVHAGLRPPYMCVGQGNFPLRVNDQSVPASLRQIEELFAERQSSEAAPEKEDVWIWANYPDASEARSGTYLRVDVDPRRPANLQFDKRTEREALSVLSGVFAEHWEYRGRGLHHLDVHRRQTGFDFHRLWRLRANGGLTFVSQVVHPSSGVVHLLDVAGDALRAVTAGRRLAQGFGVFGSLLIRIELVLTEAKCEPTGFTGAARLNPPILPGVGKMEPEPQAHPREWEADLRHGESSALVVAQALLTHLRSQRAADVDFDALQTGLSKCASDLGLE